MAVALYEPADIIRPGFPIHRQLGHYLQAATSGSDNKQKMLIIGCDARGQLPDGLNLSQHQYPGPLQLMPFVIATNDAHLAERFERSLAERGLVSSHSSQQLADTFDLTVSHVNFLSLLDLAALMRTQFEHAGFLPEWEVIETALYANQPQLRQHSRHGNEYYLYRHLVFSPFFSYDFWAKHGPGKQLPPNHRPKRWLRWLRHQRQAVAVMQTHGLDVRQYLPKTWPEPAEKICLGSIEQQVVSDDFFTEIHGAIDENDTVTVTEQHISGIGTVAYTLSQKNGRQLQHLYPLTEKALNSIPEHLQALFGQHLRLRVVNQLHTNENATALAGGWPENT